MNTIRAALFGTTTACVATAVIAAIVAVVLIGYTVYKYRSGKIDSEIMLVTWIRYFFIAACVILALYASFTAASAKEYTPPDDQLSEEEPIEDDENFRYYNLSQRELDALYPDASEYLDNSSFSSQAGARRDAIKDAYGITWTGSVGMPIRTKDEVTAIRALSAGKERDDALAAASYDAQISAINTIIPAMQHLEWLASEEYFTANNDWILEGYNWIKQTLEDPNPDSEGRVGWDKLLTVVKTPKGDLLKVDTDLHYLVMRVESVINCAEVRGIESLQTTTRWYLNEAADDLTLFPTRSSKEEDQEKLYSIIYDFSHKSQDNGKTSVPKYLVGINTADQSFGLYELTAKEDTTNKSTDNETPPATEEPEEPVVKTPEEKDPPPITVITPEPVTETHRVIQHYVDEDGNDIVRPVTQSTPVHAGAQWKADFKDLSGENANYKLSYTTTDNGDYWNGNSMYSVSGTMPDRDLNVFFHYAAQNAHIVINYVDENGKALSGRDYVGIDVWKAIGTNYRYVSPTSNADYGTPDIAVVSGTLTRKGVNETVTYRKVNSTVLIYIKNSETGSTMPGYSRPIELTGKTGTSGTYTAPTISGWQPDQIRIDIVYKDGNTYTIWYSRLPADGQGAKNPDSSSSRNPGTTDGNGSNTSSSDHTSEDQNTKPKEEGKPIIPGSNGSVPIVDSSGPSGAGDQSTTKGDTTGTGSTTDPVVKVPDTEKNNGSNPPSTSDPINGLPSSNVGTTEQKPNGSGGSNTVTVITPSDDGGKIDGVVKDID